MLIDKIKADRIAAFKAKENTKKDLLGVLIGDATKEEKIPSDDKVISTIKKFINNIDSTICLDNIDNDVYLKLSIEKEILKNYLPKQLSKMEIEKLVTGFNFQNIGECQKWFKENCAGTYDGKLVSEVFKEYKG